MERKRYEVEVVCRRRMVYAVEADGPDEARGAALAQWQDGHDGAAVGGEHWELVEMRPEEVPGDDALAADREEALRFLRDRELVIEQLSEDVFDPAIHDAMSAEEVARHQGWTTGDDGTADVVRAARALSKLCEEKRVVCFTRPRVRRGERGEVRLYCTPQHLERLSSLLVEAGAA